MNTPIIHGDLPCPACGYNLRGLEVDRGCPECGRRVILTDFPVDAKRGVDSLAAIEAELGARESERAQAAERDARIERLVGQWESRGARLDSMLDRLEALLRSLDERAM